MNCEQNDLAVYVGKDMACWGRIVTCVRLHPLGEIVTGRPTWVVEPPMPATDDPTRFVEGVADAVLKPLRDNPGTDEILRIAGHPLSKSHREKESA